MDRVPGLLDVVQDMTDPEPETRSTASQAFDRISAMTTAHQADVDTTIGPLVFNPSYPPVPRPSQSTLKPAVDH